MKVFIGASVGAHDLDLRIDVGFGDALVPPAARITLEPFLPGDESARVLAYGTGPVVAEKVETLLSKFPVVRHRLKDLLDVVALADVLQFDGDELAASLHATLDRRGTRAELGVLDEMHDEMTGRRWKTDWATMLREKAVVRSFGLADAVAKFDLFVRPLLTAETGASPGRWEPGGPWRTAE